MVPIVGGTVSGPKLNGTVEPGGADWQVVHPGGMITVDTPSEYYFRVTAQLETGAGAYYWVNEKVFVASAVRHANEVVYDLYALA